MPGTRRDGESARVPTPRTAADIVVLLQRLFRVKDFEAVRHAYHPEGRFVTLAGGPEPLGRDDTVEAFRRADRDIVYHAHADPDPIEIDEVAAMAQGAIRYRTPEGGHALVNRVWVFTQVDGLLYRTVPVTEEESGRMLYRAEGIGLGL